MESSMEPSDTELMLRVREGEVGELAVLFHRHSQRLFSYFLRLTGSREASEDLVQEVFVRILKYRRRFQARGSGFLPWVFRMAHNVGMDHFRRRRPAADADQEVSEMAADDHSPEERLQDRESLRLLERALRQIPLTGREALVLARFHGKKYTEIAEILGCSVGAVKLRVHRGMLQLRESVRRLEKEAAS